MSSSVPLAPPKKRARIATLIVGLLVGASGVTNAILIGLYATSDRFDWGFSYGDLLFSSDAVDETFRFWQYQWGSIAIAALGILIGIISLIGLNVGARITSTLAWILSVVLIVLGVTTTVLVMTTSSGFSDVKLLLIDAGAHEFGLYSLWNTVLIAAAVVVVIVALISAAASGTGATASDPASGQQAVSAVEPLAGPDHPTHTAPDLSAPGPHVSRPFGRLDGLYYLEVEGVEYGPYDAAQIVAFADEGRIVPSSLIRPEDGFYQTADQAPGLFDE